MKKGRVVVITGASAGVGRAGLEGARREVETCGGRALVLPADVADADAIEAAAAEVEKTFGPIDVWVNVAMASAFSPIKKMTAQEFKRHRSDLSRLRLRHARRPQRMLPRDHGAIIQVGSALAYRGIPLQAAYCASKHAIQGFCDSLRRELLHDGSKVRLTMVQMPALNTPQFGWVKSRLPHKAQPVPPIFQPEVAARAILFAS